MIGTKSAVPANAPSEYYTAPVRRVDGDYDTLGRLNKEVPDDRVDPNSESLDAHRNHHLVLGEGLPIEEQGHEIVPLQPALAELLQLLGTGPDEPAGDGGRTQTEDLRDERGGRGVVPVTEPVEDLEEEPGIGRVGDLQPVVDRQGDLLPGQPIAEAKGVASLVQLRMAHLLDSMWLQKVSAMRKDYERLTAEISRQTGLSVVVEEIYNWIAFLPSRVSPKAPTSKERMDLS